MLPFRGIMLMSFALTMPRSVEGMLPTSPLLMRPLLTPSSLNMQYGGQYGGGGYNGQPQQSYGQPQGYGQGGYEGGYDDSGYSGQQGPPRYGAPQDFSKPVLWSIHGFSGVTASRV